MRRAVAHGAKVHWIVGLNEKSQFADYPTAFVMRESAPHQYKKAERFQLAG